MGRLRYIGSKARIVQAILDSIGPSSGGHFVDVFSGTGVVSREAASRGWSVKANDHLVSSATITFAQLASKDDVAFQRWGGYEKAVAVIGRSAPLEGFIFDEYAPTGRSRSGQNRKYFTPANAARIDGIRSEVERLRQTAKISEAEYWVLLADLMEAVNRVANIAGTYGCFLSQFVPAAQKDLALEPRVLKPSKQNFSVTCGDAFALSCQPDDVVYLDPPYTKRQYAAYYHLLETIVIGDRPEVGGVTGLRPWRAKSSPFCFKKTAMSSLVKLCNGLGANNVFISYSSEGHVDLAELEAQLRETGRVDTISLGSIGRYRPNQVAGRSDSVTEYLVRYQRPEVVKTKRELLHSRTLR